MANELGRLFVPRKSSPPVPKFETPEQEKFLASLVDRVHTNELAIERFNNIQITSAGMQQTGNQNIADNVLTVAAGPWTKLWDANSLIDTTNNQILLPSIGVWIITAFATYNGLTGPNPTYFASLQIVTGGGSAITPAVTSTFDQMPGGGVGLASSLALTAVVLVTQDSPRQSIQIKTSISCGAGPYQFLLNLFSVYRIGNLPSIPGR